MVNSRRLLELARKWQRIAAAKRRRITFSRSVSGQDSLVANEGHFVVYTSDKRRFVVPLEYLNRNVFRELLKLSEEEFGLSIDGPITLPCDSTLLEYIILLVQGCMPEELEKALLTSIGTCHQSASFSVSQGQSQQQTLVYGY